jgi:hypothetical protein
VNSGKWGKFGAIEFFNIASIFALSLPLSALSIHFEYTENSIFADAWPICRPICAENHRHQQPKSLAVYYPFLLGMMFLSQL